MAADQFHNGHCAHKEKEYSRKISGMFDELAGYFLFIRRAGDVDGPAENTGKERGGCFIDFYPVFAGDETIAHTKDYYNGGSHAGIGTSSLSVGKKE
jgi:hypothetical protein